MLKKIGPISKRFCYSAALLIGAMSTMTALAAIVCETDTFTNGQV
jgi:hypothetical protein